MTIGPSGVCLGLTCLPHLPGPSASSHHGCGEDWPSTPEDTLAQMCHHRSQRGDPQWRPMEARPVLLAAEEGTRASEGTLCAPVRRGIFPSLKFLLQSDAHEGCLVPTPLHPVQGRRAGPPEPESRCTACPFPSPSGLSHRRAPTAFPGTGSSTPRGTAGPRLFQYQGACRELGPTVPGLLVKHALSLLLQPSLSQ
ncbi:hypothetical protein P7K49_003054 [Saguinus oedipus]|uniref:Uncharacterized protein n=1 Tax=Saguinus oedipus TaxID=9490 RepID=A0ABQ9WJ35_SAGOE|nr:hypothetical protein P7K49_003054 [Saguinus oedipus]